MKAKNGDQGRTNKRSKQLEKVSGEGLGPVDTTSIPIDMRVGAVVRRKRQQLGLTLSDMSAGCGLSSAMLSRIENGQNAASLEVLERISGALGVRLSFLMSEIDKPQGMAQLLKAGEQPEVIRTGSRYGHNYRLLSYQRGASRLFEPFLIHLDRESDEFPRFQHPGTEFIYMLEGKMQYKFGDNSYLLEPGDAFTFSGEVVHGPEDVLTEAVKFITVIVHD
ncbi:helix-turn-helix domain-containing protein [Sediminimonas qiaohouensis]|uniref:helix-turn-helix domain-containing protein n=1 Tax=Sediminimonas qiaohouensis TaxID=552061 RepID=UPI001B7F9740|nr:XRE family transcriptional regulator [Sediminimonas qiaohouensis]